MHTFSDRHPQSSYEYDEPNSPANKKYRYIINNKAKNLFFFFHKYFFRTWLGGENTGQAEYFLHFVWKKNFAGGGSFFPLVESPKKSSFFTPSLRNAFFFVTCFLVVLSRSLKPSVWKSFFSTHLPSGDLDLLALFKPNNKLILEIW